MLPSRPPLESARNARFRLWLDYVHHPEKPSCPWLPIENRRVILELAARLPLRLLLVSSSCAPPTRLVESSQETVRLRPPLFRKLSTLESPPGMLAFFDKPAWRPEQLEPWVLYLDGVQDPGNLGTLLRTARAAGRSSLVSSKSSVSFSNPKVVRASAGALFEVPFLEGLELEDLRARGYALVAATPGQGVSLFEYPFQAPQAVLLGSEGRGLDAALLQFCSQQVHIPTRRVESLNVAVAGSLVLYEMRRRGVS